MTEDRFSGPVVGEYWIYRNGDRVRLSLDVRRPGEERSLPLEAWDMPVELAREMFAKGVAVSYPTYWQAVRAVWKAAKQKVTP